VHEYISEDVLPELHPPSDNSSRQATQMPQKQ